MAIQMTGAASVSQVSATDSTSDAGVKDAPPSRGARPARARLLFFITVLVVAAVVTAIVRTLGAVTEGSATSVAARHVNTPVRYATVPASSGDHHPVWWDCGVYSEPIPDEHAVHSLEHGAVWLTYRPDVDAATVDALEELASPEHMLLSPLPEQEAAVIATAWGTQLAQDQLDVSALQRFVDEHRLSLGAPEPGASCTGGTTDDLVRRG
jgi:hypothetical protein